MGTAQNRSVANWRRWGGTGAAAGGLCLVVKGTVILFTGRQPFLLFEVAPIFLALAIIILAGRVLQEVSPTASGRAGPVWLARLAVGVAAVAGVAAFLNSLATIWPALGGGDVPGTDPASAVAGLGWLLALLLVGLAVWRRPVLRGPWRFAPLLMAAGFFPLLLLFSALSQAFSWPESRAERLIEIPLIVLGLAWIALARAGFEAGWPEHHVSA